MKRKLINSFIILSASSTISKIFSILNRMLLSRLLPLEAMSLYLVIMPTLSLCLTLGQVGIPSAVFRLILHPKYKNYKVIITAIILSFFSVIVICGTLFILSPFIAHSLLKNDYTLYPILSFLIFIPLIAISGIIKNYYLAKGHVYVIAKSQIVEETSRLLFTYFLLKTPLSSSLPFLVTIAYLSMSFGELMSIIYLLLLSRKRYSFTPLKNINKQNLIMKDLLNISLPLTGSRLYHCFMNFLEPILLIHVLTRLGLTQNLSKTNMPSFLAMSSRCLSHLLFFVRSSIASTCLLLQMIFIIIKVILFYIFFMLYLFVFLLVFLLL